MRLAIIGTAILVVVLAGAGGFMAYRVLGDDTRDVTLTEWATEYCRARVVYTRTLVDSSDTVDPQTLELEARKQRGLRLGNAQIAAAEALAGALEAIRPPEHVRAYHEALIRDVREEIEATKEQNEAVSKAANAQQIALANAAVRFRREASAQDVVAVEQNLGEDVLQALRDESNCQQIAPQQQPGSPFTPLPTATPRTKSGT